MIEQPRVTQFLPCCSLVLSWQKHWVHHHCQLVRNLVEIGHCLFLFHSGGKGILCEDYGGQVNCCSGQTETPVVDTGKQRHTTRWQVDKGKVCQYEEEEYADWMESWMVAADIRMILSESISNYTRILADVNVNTHTCQRGNQNTDALSTTREWISWLLGWLSINRIRRIRTQFWIQWLYRRRVSSSLGLPGCRHPCIAEVEGKSIRTGTIQGYL